MAIDERSSDDADLVLVRYERDPFLASVVRFGFDRLGLENGDRVVAAARSDLFPSRHRDGD